MRFYSFPWRCLLLAFSSLAVSFLAPARSDSAYRNYINRFYPLALAEQQRTGIPAAIKLAQGLLESSAGEGDLVKRSNNHFGIKCKKDWAGAVAYHDDDARGECFRAYPDAEASYTDHSNFLKANSRYASLFLLDVTDYKGWAEGLKKAGYATNPRYTSLLIKVIEENELHQYTLMAMSTQQQPSKTEMHVDTTTKWPAGQPSTPASVKANAKATTGQVIYPPGYSGYFTINGTKALYANAGTSLLAIANQHRLPLATLLEFNDMKYTLSMNDDDIIFLQAKPKKGLVASTTAAQGESLWQISQRCGVKLKYLKTYNAQVADGSLAAGTTILLQPAASKFKWLAKNQPQP